jgi:trigger factor
MSSKIEKLEGNKVKLTIDVSAEKFEESVQKAYIKARKDIKIDGFRPGKAPRQVIETQFGEGVFYEEAIDFAFPDAYRDAVTENDLYPVSSPELGIEKVSKEEGLVFTAEFWVKPEVELGKYMGVKAEKMDAKVSDDDVSAQVDKIADQNATYVEVTRQAKDGDKVTIDFSGSIDGELFDGGTAQGYTLDLGTNTFIEGFEPQLVGMAIDEEKDVTVKFPEQYQAENLAGKDAVFACKLHKVEEKQLPVIDDEFAKDVSEFETMDEYVADVKAKLIEKAEADAKTVTENNVVSAVVKTSKLDVPACMVDSQIAHHIKQFEQQLMYQGMKLDDYLQYTGTKIEDIKAQYADQALETIQTQLVLEAVMVAEKIEASEDEIDAELAKNAEQIKKTLEEYKQSVPANTIDNIRTKITFDKTIDLLVTNAKLK